MNIARRQSAALLFAVSLVTGCQAFHGTTEDQRDSQSAVRSASTKPGDYWGFDERARAIERRLESKEFNIR